MRVLSNHHRAISSSMHPHAQVLFLVPQFFEQSVRTGIAIVQRTAFNVGLDSGSVSVLPAHQTRTRGTAERGGNMKVGKTQPGFCELLNIGQVVIEDFVAEQIHIGIIKIDQDNIGTRRIRACRF